MTNVTPRKTAVFTIVSKNYLHYARTLMQSVKSVHESWDRYVLLVDEVRGDFEPTKEDFTVVEVRELPLPDMDKFLFRYTILELNTAVKPWMLEWLFENSNYEKVVYIDPDIYLYQPMKEVEEALDSGKLMVLTPHLTGQLDDCKRPTELDIMRAGSYNLGFIALARHPSLHTFLKWWQDKLEYQCVVNFEAGLFVDQKWMDLVPGMYQDVYILRHEGYNVAYWNLLHRNVSRTDVGYLVNGVPLVFCHYSGIDPENPQQLSKYQNRFELSDLPEFKRLALEYCNKVIANGLKTCKQWEYSFGRFADETPIEDSLRVCYRNTSELQASAGNNPFAAREKLAQSLQTDHGMPITPIMRHLWEQRSDLKNAFPDILGRDMLAYAQWFVDHGARENGIAEEFVAPVRAALANGGGKLSPLSRLFLNVTYKAGPAVVNLFPNSLRQLVRRKILGSSPRQQEATLVAPSATKVTVKAEPDGINIIGYVRSEHGLGESSRRCASAVLAAGIPFLMYDFNIGNSSRILDNTFEQYIAEHNSHKFNLIHINADQMPVLYRSVGTKFFKGHYNIGFWHWELPDFPDEWLGAFELLDEVWAPTSFVVQAISEKSPVPVLRMPHAIDFAITGSLSRSSLGLPENEFLFLTMYDLSSFQARKNPQAVIKAFHHAFPDQSGVRLVVKTQNSQFHPNELKELQDFIAENPGIIHIDKTMTRQEVYELEALCDCFVSLHRSEGFGLGLAESMFLGKPVIGTNWSANTDFMNHQNSCPVDYRMVQLECSYGPYAAGQSWADPDLEHAAWFMKKLVTDQTWRDKIAKAGEQTIKTQYSPKVIGEMYKKRFKYIGCK